MNSKHRKTLEMIFNDPVHANIKWKDIEALLVNMGCSKKEGNGSRVRFELNKIVATFHRPHPRRDVDKGTIKSIRKFINTLGINNDEI